MSKYKFLGNKLNYLGKNYIKGDVVEITDKLVHGIGRVNFEAVESDAISNVVVANKTVRAIGGGMYNVLNANTGEKINTTSLTKEQAYAMIGVTLKKEEVKKEEVKEEVKPKKPTRRKKK